MPADRTHVVYLGAPLDEDANRDAHVDHDRRVVDIAEPQASVRLLVVATAEVDGHLRFDVMQERQGVGRQDLEVDAELVHASQPDIEIHERRPPVPHALEDKAANAKAGWAARRLVSLVQLGPVGAGRAEGRLEHDVGMDVDHGNSTG